MKTLRLLAVVALAMAIVATPVMAQPEAEKAAKEHELTKLRETRPTGTMILSGTAIGAGLGAAIAIVGAGWGFGRIGAAALESMARQPEVAPRIQTAMIIIGALLEGATFFALIVCVLVNNRVGF